MMKSKFKKLLPRWALSAYHCIKAYYAAAWNKFPSRGMVIVGVTGTKGKTTTANYIWAVFTAGGKRTGLVSTAIIRMGDKQMLNPYHMTMPGPFVLENLLRVMKEEGCTHCVIETTSEGLAQWRHIGIWYDIAVLTNLFPEHIEAHGNFETYRAAKGKLFCSLTHHPRKVIEGEEVDRLAIVNQDIESALFFKKFPSDRVITFGLTSGSDYRAEEIKSGGGKVTFRIRGVSYELNLLGEFNVENALPAVVLGEIMEFPPETIATGLASLKRVPGRMEIIDEGQKFGVIVDYAHEKMSMEKLLRTGRTYIGKRDKLIVLLGAEGGGRDKRKRPAMGEVAGNLADYIVVSNVDPYDDDPKEIIEDIAKAAEAAGKMREENLFCIEDRREGIRKALSLAKKGDVVLITGKGAEQSMIVKNEKLPWDDRMVVKEELQALRK